MKMTKIGDIVSPDSEVEKDFELYIQMKLEYILMQNSRVEAILKAARKFIDTGDFDYFPWLEEISEDENESDVSGKKKEAFEIDKEAVRRRKDSEEQAFEMRNKKHDDSEVSEEQKKIKQDKAKAAYNLFDEANVEAVTNAVENAFIKKG